MDNLELLMKTLDEAHWELSEAMKDMPDEDLWRRPHPRLLSVGELIAHMAYGEATNIHGGELDSPLVQHQMRYYPVTVEEPLKLEMSAEAAFKELERVHQLCNAKLLADPPNLEATNPNRDDWNWGYTFRYMTFHIAYHTGQIYSVRHLLGHETVDN